jgi:hypothetical protein
MNRKLTQAGFSALDTVLAVVLVAAIGAAGYFAYINMHKSSQSPTASASPLPHETPSPSQDPTAAWKTYHSSYENASFKYPSDWAYKQGPSQDPSASQAYSVTLTSPHGLVLKYDDAVSGIGGTCAPGAKNVTLTKAQPVAAIKSSQTVYLAENNSGVGLAGIGTEIMRSAPPDLDTGTCATFFTVASKVHASASFITFGTNLNLLGDSPALSATQRQDYPTAEQILESFRY